MVTNKKLVHDYQSDLAGLKEGLELLDQSTDPVLREKVLKLLIAKCKKLSGDFNELKMDLEQRMGHELPTL